MEMMAGSKMAGSSRKAWFTGNAWLPQSPTCMAAIRQHIEDAYCYGLCSVYYNILTYQRFPPAGLDLKQSNHLLGTSQPVCAKLRARSSTENTDPSRCCKLGN